MNPARMTARDTVTSKSKRRWLPRYSLRTLMIGITCLGIVMIPLSLRYKRYRDLRVALAAVEQLDGSVTYGKDGRVKRVSFTSHRPLNNKQVALLAAHLSRFERLSWLEIQSGNLDDKVAKDLGSLDSLETLVLVGARITDEGFSSLVRLPNLKRLVLSGEIITDESLTELGQLSGLVSLHLSSAGVTDHGISHLAKLPDLRQVSVNGTSVTNAGLQTLAEHVVILSPTTTGAVP